MAKEKNVLIAFKAICLAPELRDSDRKIAAALLDHFNRKTGQCDPSRERIAGLLNLSVRTVIRAVKRIVATDLFRKVRHGGHLNRNSYEPNWARCREIEAGWSQRMRMASKWRATKVSPGIGQPCHVDGDTAVTLTCLRNQSKETSLKRNPKKDDVDRGDIDSRLIETARPSRQLDAARSIAERRWSTDLNDAFASRPITYAEIIDNLTIDLQEAATTAELRSRGAGLRLIASELKLGAVR